MRSEEAGQREESALPLHMGDRRGLRDEQPKADYSFGAGIFLLRRSSRPSRAFRTDFMMVTSVSTTVLTCESNAGATISTSEAFEVPEKADNPRR